MGPVALAGPANQAAATDTGGPQCMQGRAALGCSCLEAPPTDLDLTLVHCDVKKGEAVLEVAGMDGRLVVGSESGGAGHRRGWSSAPQVRSGQVYYSAEVWDHESHKAASATSQVTSLEPSYEE